MPATAKKKVMTAKNKLMKEYQKAANDTGSPSVQVALISARIDDLTKHLQSYKKDHHSRYGLMKLVSQRRKLLNYLKKTNLTEYQSLIQRLGIRN